MKKERGTAKARNASSKVQMIRRDERDAPEPAPDQAALPAAVRVLPPKKPPVFSSGEAVAQVQDALVTLRFGVSAQERETRTYGPSTRDAVASLQRDEGLPITGTLDERTVAALEARAVRMAGDRYAVEGRLMIEDGLPAAGVTVRGYRLDLGGKEERLFETQSDANGFFAGTYAYLGESAPVLQLRAANGRRAEANLTEWSPQRERRSVADLVVPDGYEKLESEHARLLSSLPKGVDLASVVEDERRKDVSLLHERTQWDPRLLAMASLAATLAKKGVPQGAAYGMLRAGLPSDSKLLAAVPPRTVDQALRRSAEAGVVAMNDAARAKALAAFAAFAAAERNTTRAPGTVSTFRELLDGAPIKAPERAEVAKLWASHADDPAAFFKAVAKALPGVEPKLRVHGKLAYLTSNNAPLMAALNEKLKGGDPLETLVARGFHQPEAWVAQLNALARGDAEKLASLIPDTYSGATGKARLAEYAADLARTVRMSFPMRVVRQLIAGNELTLVGKHKERIGKILEAAELDGVELGGSSPKRLSQFIRERRAQLFQGVADDVRVDIERRLLALQCLHQITPSDASLKALDKLALFRSAHDIVAFGRSTFLERFGKHFPAGEAALVFDKAEQAVSVVYNAFSTARQLSVAGAVAAVGPAADALEATRKAVEQKLQGDMPTLEALFGSMDFCPCGHCRSVLSPAAYLVDLLRFLDPPDNVWSSNRSAYEAEHGAYPGSGTPYDELVARRPDLAELPLTCENTNTELPYIDIVSEILEYYVAKGKVEAAAVRDTGTAATADLVAEPRYLIPEAYERLKGELFPLSAPFDLDRERVRAFFAALEEPWHEVLDALRKVEDLDSTNEVALEAVRLGPYERKPFTDVPVDSWFLLYGYATRAKADELFVATNRASAKLLARRLSVTYEELVTLVQTRYVNPDLHTLVYLRKAGLTEYDVVRWKAPAGDPLALTDTERAAFDARLGKLEQEYPGFKVKRLDDAWSDGAFKRIAVLADPSGGCLFDGVQLKFVDGAASLDGVLHRLNVFVRLWRKLGWTIEEIDQLLDACAPEKEKDPANEMLAMLVSARWVNALHEDLELPRETILTFWNDVPTTGPRPLYDRLFLLPGILVSDAVFDDVLGEYLAQGAKLGAHLPAVQAAVGLSAQDVALLVADPDGETLTVALVSRLYRHAALAKALELPLRDLLRLEELSGLDPFDPLTKKAPSSVDEIHPLSRTWAFVRLARGIAERDIEIAELDYLVSHRFDPLSEERAADAIPETLLRGLTQDLGQLETDLSFPPGELTAELLAPKLSLVFTPEVADAFLGMWTGTRDFYATTPSALDAANFADEPRFSVVEGAVEGEFQLHYRGVVTPKIATKLKVSFSTGLQKQLIDDLQAQAERFADDHPTLLQKADLDALFPDTRDLTSVQREAASRERREKLLATLVPTLRASLTLRAVVRNLAAELDADERLVERCIGDATFLADPTTSGATLLEAFQSARARGLTATFRDGAGTVLVSPRVVEGTRLSAGELPAGTKTVSLDGLFEVPAPTGLRFVVTLERAAARAKLAIDGTDVFDGTGKKVEGAVRALAAGTFHRLALEVTPAGGGLELEVVGDVVPRGPLSSLRLWPAGDVERVRQAKIRLAKALRLAELLGLDADELALLFGNDHVLDRTTAPLVLPSTPPAPGSASIEDGFQRIARMLDYVALRHAVVENGRGLMALFAAKTRGELLAAGAALFPADAGAFQAVVDWFGVTAPATLRDAERIAGALRVVAGTGISVADLTRWTTANPIDSEMSRGVRDVVKTHFSQGVWRDFARPIFDKLRKLQRDALVACAMQEKGADTVEDLFKDFLLDPGQEPVVLTSRIQLAISSVQTFVQRCFLNLEARVPPAVLDARAWQWMKRYRVWEANRKIFLWPENWLEPELRDDASHLYTELVGALLQGEVSDDLVEKAFFDYLQGLEEIARLEIVTTYHEYDAVSPSSSTLHVLARTYASPVKYFYRRYAHEMWSPWLPVKANVDGDHVTLAVWRDRVHVLWVTLTEKRDENDQVNATSSPEDLRNKSIAGMRPPRQVNLQLSWIELFKGKWVNQKSTGVFASAIDVPDDFDRRRVRIHVSHDGLGLDVHLSSAGPRLDLGHVDAGAWFAQVARADQRSLSGNLVRVQRELADTAFVAGPFKGIGGVFQLDLPHLDVTFHLRSKHAKVELEERGRTPPAFPVSLGSEEPTPTGFEGSGPLQVYFTQKTVTDSSGVTRTDSGARSILQDAGQLGAMAVVPSSNEVAIAAKSTNGLLTPFFLQDPGNTLYVEPSLTETTLHGWDRWIVAPVLGVFELPDDVLVRPQKPLRKPPVAERLEQFVDPPGDWVTRPETIVMLNGTAIGAPAGRGGRPTVTAVRVAGAGGLGSRVRFEAAPARSR